MGVEAMDCAPSKEYIPLWERCTPVTDDSVLSCEKEGGGGYDCEAVCMTDAAMAGAGDLGEIRFSPRRR